MFSALLLTGIFTGVMYGTIAVGLVIVFKSTKIFNLAVGEILAIGAYVCWWLASALDMPIYVAMPLALLTGAVLGWLVNKVIICPMIGQPLMGTLMATIGLAVFLKGIIFITWGTVHWPFPPFLPNRYFAIGEVGLRGELVGGFIVCMAVFAALLLFYRYSRRGLLMRATAENHQIAQSTGMSVMQIFSFSFIISAVVLMMAGFCFASLMGVHSDLINVGLKCLAPILIGGLESIWGAMIGGIIVGVIEILAGRYLDPLVGGGVKEVAPFMVLLIVLIFKPYGLFGLKRIERV